MSDNEEDNRDYDVGYGRPPKWTQFQKGESGNPRGRPPKKRIKHLLEMSETDKAARAELDRMIQIKEGGEIKKLPMRNVLLKTLMAVGAKGNPHALKLAVGLSHDLDKRDAERAVLEEQQKQDAFETFKKFREARVRIWKEAEREGKEPDEPWPHPDDILLDHALKEYRIRGPFFTKEVPLFEYLRCERDVAFGEAMLYWLDTEGASEEVFKLYMMAFIIRDRDLPLRWQYMPRYDETQNRLCLHIPGLRRWTEKRQAELERLRPLYGWPKNERAAKRVADRIMRRATKSLGFTSREEFEKRLRAA